MNKVIQNLWIRFISYYIWTAEKLFFYPYLKKFYLEQNIKLPIVLDIGANRGQSIEFFKKILDKPVIYAVEASKNTFSILQSKFKRDKYVKLHNLAISHVDDELIFYECIFDEVSSLEMPNIDNRYFKFKSKVLLSKPENMFTKSLVKAFTLDTFCNQNNINKIDILKIDIEGHELSALKGGRGMFENKNIRFVQLEIHYDQQYKLDPKIIYDTMHAFSYKEVFRKKHFFGNFYDVIFELSDFEKCL